MKINSKDSFKSLKKLKVDNKIYNIFSLKEAERLFQLYLLETKNIISQIL